MKSFARKILGIFNKKVLLGFVSVVLATIFAISPTVADNAKSTTATTPRFNFLQNDLELLAGANYTKNQTNWSDPVNGAYSADIGDEIVFRFYFHNGMENTVARNTILRALLPNEPSTNIKVLSYLASQDTPLITDTVVNGQIVGAGNGYTEVNLKNTGRLEYVPGSTKIWRSDPNEQGVTLRDGVTSNDGINIGNIAGCWQYAGYVTFKTVVKSPAQLVIDKFVAYPGTQTWDTILEDAKEGETVAWKVRVANNGQTVAKNVLVSDILPSKLSYINGTTAYFGPETSTSGVQKLDTFSTTGLTIAEIRPGIENTISIVFQTKIGSDLQYGPGGVSELVNWTQATYNNQTVKDMAKVTVIGRAGIVVDKQVQLPDGSFGEQSTAKIGDTINYKITIKNIAEQNLTNLKVNDVLPVYTYFVAGSTKVNGVAVADGITGNGINIGSLARGQSVVVTLSVVTYGCPPIGDYTLSNTAYATIDQLVGISDIATTILRLNKIISPEVSGL